MSQPAVTPARLAVIGPLVDNDLVFAEHLARYGHDVTVLRRKATGESAQFGGGGFSRFTAADVVEFSSPLELVAKVRRFDYVFTFTGSYPFGLFYLLPLYPVLMRLGWPRYMNIGTGSDIMERAVAGGLDGLLQRLGMRLAHMNMVLNYPVALRNVAKLRLANACILPFPYIPAQVETEPANEAEPAKPGSGADTFVLLHPGHLDWGQTDNAPGRVSTKGNDRFIRALARFVRETHRPVRVIMLDRGSDRLVARRMVEDLGLAAYVDWRGHMSRTELYTTMAACHLVVDQFDVGGLGGIAWEAMALGKPVLMHLAMPNDLLSYDEATPILPAKSEDEILAALHQASDPLWLEAQCRRVKAWMTVHEPGRFIPRYLLYASLATGKDLCGFWSDELPAVGHADAG